MQTILLFPSHMKKKLERSRRRLETPERTATRRDGDDGKIGVEVEHEEQAEVALAGAVVRLVTAGAVAASGRRSRSWSVNETGSGAWKRTLAGSGVDCDPVQDHVAAHCRSSLDSNIAISSRPTEQQPSRADDRTASRHREDDKVPTPRSFKRSASRAFSASDVVDILNLIKLSQPSAVAHGSHN